MLSKSGWATRLIFIVSGLIDADGFLAHTRHMKTIIALLLASCVVSLAQMNADNPVSASDIKAPLDATGHLMSAADSGDMETIKLLLKNGADINAKDEDGETALWYAAGSGQTDAAKLLLDKGADINTKDNYGVTAMMYAAGHGQTEAVNLLLARGADINAKDKSGETAMMKAAEVAGGQTHTDVIKLLLGKGADINAKTTSGVTALMWASGAGQTDVIKLLLDKGADINAKNTYGVTALMYAAGEGQTDAVKLLLDKGADFNAKDKSGETAMMNAVGAGGHTHTDVVKLLLDKGADINAKNALGQTALDEARECGSSAIVQLLQQAAAIPAPTLGKPFNSVVTSGTNTDSQGYVTNAALLTPFTLTNSVGDVFTNAILVKLMPNKFIYKTPTGVQGMLRLNWLSKELQERFGYDAASAAAQDAIEEETKMRATQWQQSQMDLAQQQAELKAQSQVAVADISSTIRAKAEKEWPGDYEMQKYIINQQTSAYNWLVTASTASGVPQNVFDQIRTKAAGEWPDDYEMQKYEINQQVKAYTELH